MPHYLQKPLEEVIDQLDLGDREKTFIKKRWLDQLIYADKRASRDQKRYFRLRMVTIVGGVLVPALVSLGNVSDDNTRLRHVMSWGTFLASLTVAVSAAVEEFFQYGESYRRFRSTAEGMKIEGWSYFQLSGPYENAIDHQQAYKTFAAHIENIIKKDVEGYNAEMMKKQEKEQDDNEGTESQPVIQAVSNAGQTPATETTAQPSEATSSLEAKVEPTPAPASTTQTLASETVKETPANAITAETAETSETIAAKVLERPQRPQETEPQGLESDDIKEG